MVIDVLSKYAWVEPIKDKTVRNVERYANESDATYSNTKISCSIVHFQDNEASYTFHTAEEYGRLIDKKVCRIPVGIYDSLEELVEAINSANGTY